ncbi:MAG: GntR family transcriptional regulator [Microbacteriaceae bacterium]|nr:GntR family transcriptional regulator [Microbacteriaceae bacterium]
MSDATRYLREPLLTSPGQPLRVAVYSRISQGIRSGTLVAGKVLPREAELGLALGVSRTVVREALMLLEEDGLIVTKRGIGRFVSDSIPHEGGLDEFQPLEYLLAEPTTSLRVDVIEFTLQKATDFVSDQLGLAETDDFWFRECVVTRDGLPVALVQEYLPDEVRLATLNENVSRQLRDAARQPATLLQAITERVGPVFRPGACRIAASVAGPTRAGHLQIKSSDPLLVLTQTAELAGVPAYATKCALPPAFGHLAVTQWKPA